MSSILKESHNARKPVGSFGISGVLLTQPFNVWCPLKGRTYLHKLQLKAPGLFNKDV